MKTEVMKTQGAFSWNELMTSDVQGAKAFYGELLGWVLNDMESDCMPEGMSYTMAKVGGVERAGIMELPAEAKANGMPPTWGSYITVDDVDAMVLRVVKLGGKICVPPQDIPNVGRFSVITDPQGAAVSLITYFDME